MSAPLFSFRSLFGAPILPRRRRPQADSRDYALRAVYIDRLRGMVWSVDSMGHEVRRMCSDAEDPEIVAGELLTDLDRTDPIPADQFSPPPLHGRDRSHLRLL